jgi:hypothetical protein
MHKKVCIYTHLERARIGTNELALLLTVLEGDESGHLRKHCELNEAKAKSSMTTYCANANFLRDLRLSVDVDLVETHSR